jgi:hypothetical protein
VCHCIVGVALLLRHESSGGRGPAGVVLPVQEGSGDGINYDNKDGGGRHKIGGAGNANMQQEQVIDDARQQQGCKNNGRDLTLRA